MDKEITIESTYTVKSGNFEGPLEVLLDLIEKRKLFVNEVSLAEVTADYIEYVRSLPKVNLIDTTSFVLVAATLILIKSRSLLPNLALTNEEEEKITNLESRLKLYAAMRDAGEYIRAKFGKEIIYFREPGDVEVVVFTPHPSISQINLKSAIEGVISRIPKKEILQEVSVRKVINIEEMINSLSDRIQEAMQISFSDFSKHPNPEDEKAQKVYTIVSFLAMLELVRNGIVDVLQGEVFSDMTITKLDKSEI